MKNLKDKLAGKKAKIEAKADKLKGKLKGLRTAIVALLILASVTGCNMTPSRSQSNEYNHCYINVFVPATPCADTNNAIAAVYGDWFNQQMSVENSGTETQTPTQTISPQTTATYAPAAGSTDALSSLVSLGAKAITSSTSNGTTTVKKETVKSSDSACADGSCELKK